MKALNFIPDEWNKWLIIAVVVVFPWVPAIAIHLDCFDISPSISDLLYILLLPFALKYFKNIFSSGIAGVYTTFSYNLEYSQGFAY